MALLDQIRIVDLLDIALVSVIIYAVYTLFWGTRAARVLFGVAAVGLLYVIARYLDLGLTVKILQAFFAVIIIALIVIFQDEMRRLFEHIGDQRWLGKSLSRKEGAVSSVERRIQTLVDTVADLADKRIGALIVLESTTDVLSFTSGGIALNGQLSESIVKSIFDPHSQGHDGAIIVSGDMISRFACHLPLSTDTMKTAEFGTRHAAAIGIAERTDAACIVVSEERGTIAVARDGKLVTLERPTQLTGALYDFYAPMAAETATGWTRNIVPKLISIALAIILWILAIRLSAGA